MNAFTGALSRAYERTKYKAIKNGPAIAVITGLVGMGTSLYLMHRATTKIEEAKKTREDNLKKVDSCLEAGCITDENGKVTDIYNTSDAERDTKIYKSRYIMSVVKYLAPPISLAILSGTLIFLGFKKEAARLATAGATIAGLLAQQQETREELECVAGQKAANDIALGKHSHMETEISEDGEVKTIEKTTTNRYISGYTFEFSKESSPVYYSGIYKRDCDFITGTQNLANYYMKEKKGFVTFADILQEMDVPMDGCGYVLDCGSVKTDGHTIVFDIDERKSEDGKTYFIITVNFQGYIKDKI